MTEIVLNTSGEILENRIMQQPCLSIAWGKAYGNVYCHHAVLSIPYESDSLFEPEIAEINVKVRMNRIENTVIKSFTDKVISFFLPCSYKDGRCIVPLNSPELIKALCENEWTKLKDGVLGAPKSHPLSISVTLESQPVTCFEFNHADGKYPYTLCEDHFKQLSNGQTIETAIVLK